MSAPDYDRHFRDYAAAYERSLGERVDTEAVRGFFAQAFVMAGAHGQVHAGRNDDEFEQTLQQGYAFYKSIGTRRMRVEHVQAQPLVGGHDLVRVFYRGEYERRDGTSAAIPFEVVYLLQRRADGPRIFGFIAGDEMGLYREHGLIDDQGRPRA